MNKEFMKETFTWFKKDGQEQGVVGKNWKSNLANYIYEEMRKEGKNIKRESVLRNLNRMINYYEGTGKQARTGKTYLPYIGRYFERMREAFLSAGGRLSSYWRTNAEARAYRGEIPSLKTLPDFPASALGMYRFGS